MATNLFYIFGLQRSGTNFLYQVMIQNYNCKCVNNTQRGYGWKHTIKPNLKELDITHAYPILMSKNPYTWIESLSCRNNVDWVKRQKEYRAWEIEDIDPRLVLGKNKFNVVELARAWKDWHMNWVIEPEFDVAHYHLLYEDMLDDERRKVFLRHMANEVGFKRKLPNKWTIPKKGGISQSKDYNDNREQYYKEGKPKQLTPYMIRKVNEIITEDVITKVGYQVIRETADAD